MSSVNYSITEGKSVLSNWLHRHDAVERSSVHWNVFLGFTRFLIYSTTPHGWSHALVNAAKWYAAVLFVFQFFKLPWIFL